ncbi:MAG TPA: TetR family transcriptional regulator [Solirubrobacteraceae bacterium]|jgi:AcrR family transcriptional regulator|nr:TetR family transcriptional regulator [Solirubrobacteraceae bacterium]
MVRWEPDSRGRLEQAAMELYGDRGFENTTVAEIAERAGVTERTFFRHFADKREVLFGGSGALKEQMVAAVAGAPVSAPPIEAVAAGLDVLVAVLGERRDFSRRRRAIIAANAELRERELIKLALLASAMAAVLRTRGVAEPTASLAAEAGMAAFRVAWERWTGEADEANLPQLIRESLDELRAVTGSGGS